MFFCFFALPLKFTDLYIRTLPGTQVLCNHFKVLKSTVLPLTTIASAKSSLLAQKGVPRSQKLMAAAAGTAFLRRPTARYLKKFQKSRIILQGILFEIWL